MRNFSFRKSDLLSVSTFKECKYTLKANNLDSSFDEE